MGQSAGKIGKYCRQADIIVVAVGKPGLITKDMVKPGACVIDVGINRIKDETTGKFRLVGDVDFEGEWGVTLQIVML